jgi:LysR family transcriptional regulator for metE and metH
MIEVRHLRLIRALVEEGGPSRAAAKLRLTQSAVSHQLAELEEKLKIKLFTRVKKQLQLTAAGARLLDASRTLLPQLAALESELHQNRTQKREALWLSVESFTAYHWLPSFIIALSEEHPHIDVRLRIEANRDPVASLLKSALDVALVSTTTRERSLLSTPLFEDEWAVLLPPQHPLAKKKYISTADLSKEILITHQAPRSDLVRLKESFDAEGSPLPRVVTVPLTEVLVGMVQAGLGLGLVSRWVSHPFEARGDIVARRFTREGMKEQWYAVYRRDSCARLPMPRVVELLAQHVSPQ